MLEHIYSSSKRQPFLRDCQKVSSKQYELQPNNTFHYHLSKYPKQDIIKYAIRIRTIRKISANIYKINNQ